MTSKSSTAEVSEEQAAPAMVVVDLGIPFFVDVALGADSMARELGCSLVICTSGEDTLQEE